MVFEKRIDIGITSEGNSVTQTSDGGYFIGGDYLNTFSETQIKPFVAKSDSNGNILWVRALTSLTSGAVNSVISLFDGTSIAAGGGFSENIYDGEHLFVVTFDRNGNEVRSYLGDLISYDTLSGLPITISPSRDSGYILGANGIDGIGKVLKFDKNGVVEWNISLRNDSSNAAKIDAIVELSDGSFLIGAEDTLTAAADMVFTKLSHDRRFLWQRSIQKVGTLQGLTNTLDGGFAVTGIRQILPDFDEKVYVLKFDSNGSLHWNTVVEALGIEEAYAITESKNGDLIIAGSKLFFDPSTGNNEPSILLERIDKKGTPQSVILVDLKSTISLGSQIVRTSDDGFVMTGYMSNNFPQPFSATQSAIALKFDKDLHGCNIKEGLFTTIPFEIRFDSLTYYYTSEPVTTLSLGPGSFKSYKEGDLCDPFTYSEPPDAHIAVYPNPLSSDELLNLSFDGMIPAGSYMMVTRDILGRIIKKNVLPVTGSKEDIPIDLRGYPGGIYYVELWNEDGSVFLRRIKFVKE